MKLLSSRFKFLLLGLAIVFVIFGAENVFALAFGVSPPSISKTFEDGNAYAPTIYLIRDDASTDLNISTRFDVPEQIRSWFSVDRGINFVMPKGSRQFPIQITANVPFKTPPGKYSGALKIFALSASSSEILSLSVPMDLTIIPRPQIPAEQGVWVATSTSQNVATTSPAVNSTLPPQNIPTPQFSAEQKTPTTLPLKQSDSTPPAEDNIYLLVMIGSVLGLVILYFGYQAAKKPKTN